MDDKLNEEMIMLQKRVKRKISHIFSLGCILFGWNPQTPHGFSC